MRAYYDKDFLFLFRERRKVHLEDIDYGCTHFFIHRRIREMTFGLFLMLRSLTFVVWCMEAWGGGGGADRGEGEIRGDGE